MASKEPIPILLSGRNARLAKAVAAKLSPEYDVVHMSITHHADMTEIPAILQGHLVTPSFTGSNLYRAFSERRKPAAVVFSSAVPRSEVAEIKCLTDCDLDAKDVKLIQYGTSDVLKYGFPGSTATARLMRDLLKAEGL